MTKTIKQAIEFFINGRWIDGKYAINRRRHDRRVHDRRVGGERRHPMGNNDRRKNITERKK